MLKIAYFTPFALNSPTAASVRAKHIIKELQKSYDVTLLTHEESFFPTPSNKHHFLLRLIFELMHAMSLFIKILLGRYELTILSSPSYVTTLTCTFLLRCFRKKYFLDIRDIYPEVFFYLNLVRENSLLGKALKRATHQMYINSLGITCATEGLKKIIHSYHVKSVVVFNGFDENLFYQDIKRKKFTLIFHGNLSRMQNLDLLIQIAQKIPNDIEIIVAGSGSKEHLLIENEKINFLGNLPHEEVAEIVRSSHIGLSFRDDGHINETSFPVKIFEYIGSGIPVISTPKSEAGETLERMGYGYQFGNKQINEIIRKIEDLKKDYYSYKPDLIYSRKYQSKKFKDHFDKSVQFGRKKKD